MARRLPPLLILALVALILPATSVAADAPAASHAAKLKACKKGANSKKCRCPKGSKLVKKNHKYRCKKKKPPPQQGEQGTGGDNTGTGGDNTDPGTGGDNTGAPTGTGNGAQTQRDDAGYTAALSSTRFGPHNVEGSYGYST